MLEIKPTGHRGRKVTGSGRYRSIRRVAAPSIYFRQYAIGVAWAYRLAAG